MKNKYKKYKNLYDSDIKDNELDEDDKSLKN